MIRIYNFINTSKKFKNEQKKKKTWEDDPLILSGGASFLWAPIMLGPNLSLGLGLGPYYCLQSTLTVHFYVIYSICIMHVCIFLSHLWLFFVVCLSGKKAHGPPVGHRPKLMDGFETRLTKPTLRIYQFWYANRR